MRDFDVRNLEGRFARLFAAMVIGVTAAIVIALILPQQGLGYGAGPSTFAVPALVLAGAVAFTIAIYGGLHALSCRLPLAPPSDLPRAKLLRRRRRAQS